MITSTMGRPWARLGRLYIRQKRLLLISTTFRQLFSSVPLRLFMEPSPPSNCRKTSELVKTLAENTKYFRTEISAKGFKIKDGLPDRSHYHGDERTVEMAREMNTRGILSWDSLSGLPRGEAEFECGSAAHSREQLQKAVQTFADVGKLKVI